MAPPRTFNFTRRCWPNTPDEGASDAAPAAASTSTNRRLLVIHSSSTIRLLASPPPAIRAPAQIFDLSGPPRLLEPRVERSVETQDREPALAGNRFDPVGFFAQR